MGSKWTWVETAWHGGGGRGGRDTYVNITWWADSVLWNQQGSEGLDCQEVTVSMPRIRKQGHTMSGLNQLRRNRRLWAFLFLKISIILHQKKFIFKYSWHSKLFCMSVGGTVQWWDIHTFHDGPLQLWAFLFCFCLDLLSLLRSSREGPSLRGETRTHRETTQTTYLLSELVDDVSPGFRNSWLWNKKVHPADTWRHCDPTHPASPGHPSIINAI